MFITSSNSTFTLMIPPIFPSPQVLEGYAVDDAFSVDDLVLAEVQMGVDGKMSAGFTPNVSTMTISLQADSPSILVFEYWTQVMKGAKEIFVGQGAISILSVSKNYILTNGVLTAVKQLSDAKKVLAPQSFTITWETITPSPV